LPLSCHLCFYPFFLLLLLKLIFSFPYAHLTSLSSYAASSCWLMLHSFHLFELLKLLVVVRFISWSSSWTCYCSCGPHLLIFTSKIFSICFDRIVDCFLEHLNIMYMGRRGWRGNISCLWESGKEVGFNLSPSSWILCLLTLNYGLWFVGVTEQCKKILKYRFHLRFNAN